MISMNALSLFQHCRVISTLREIVILTINYIICVRVFFMYIIFQEQENLYKSRFVNFINTKSFFCVLLCVFLSPIILIQFIVKNEKYQNSTCVSSVTYYSVALIIIMTFFCFFLLLFIRQKVDLHFLKNEFSTINGLNVLLIIVYIINIIGEPVMATKIKHFYIEAMIITIAMMPLILSIHYEKNMSLLRNKTIDYNETLKKILRNPPKKNAFREFLKKELSVENLDFYDAVEAFKNDQNSIKNQTYIKIYQNFFDSCGNQQLNLRGDLRMEVKIMIEKGDVNLNMFDKTRDYIFNIMAYDALLRFLN